MNPFLKDSCHESLHFESFWAHFGIILWDLQAFATVKRTEKHLIFVSERDRVFSVKPNAGKGETKTKYNKVNAKHLKFS